MTRGRYPFVQSDDGELVTAELLGLGEIESAGVGASVLDVSAQDGPGSDAPADTTPNGRCAQRGSSPPRPRPSSSPRAYR